MGEITDTEATGLGDAPLHFPSFFSCTDSLSWTANQSNVLGAECQHSGPQVLTNSPAFAIGRLSARCVLNKLSF